MKTVVMSKSVEYMPFFLSFFAFFNGGIWTFYSVLVQDWFLGAKTATLAGILNVGFPVAVILVTYLRMQGDLRIDVIGFMCAGLNIVMYASPLAAM
ncbi:unnamed protein product [Camellia sinensis]